MPLSNLPADCFTISQLARELGISTRSIRYYEEKELISPRRTRGNQRFYGKRDRARLKLILRGKRFGYSLNEIAEMIGHTEVDMEEREQIRKSLQYGEKKLSEIYSRIEELQKLAWELTSLKEKLVRRLREIENASLDGNRGQ
jgi:DNA-binding transcriptional MerR regulator